RADRWWSGGRVHLRAAPTRRGQRPWPVALLRRFSNLALTSVVVLVAAGVGLSIYNVDDVPALVGTAYGLMVMTKVVMLAGLLVLGALNSRAIRRMDGGPEADQVTMRRFVEVEVGLGLTVLF